jgi:adenylate cyclase
VALAWLERAGDRRYVESETRIGRGDRNNFQLNDPSISRDHALIRRVEGDYLLSDLDSSNGTFVNDERVYEPRRLSTGDRVRLATVEFSFNIDQPAFGATQDVLERPLATSISQFLTLSGQISTQDYLEGDLRVVTVLFLDLCGFTALSERMSPEQITVVVNQCFQHLTETATRFGGYVDKYIGDAMMVLFGAPQAHDDDAERSVRAAIAMQERLTQFSRRLKERSGIALQMRVGINTGEVLAGSVGSGQFTAFTVMGDAVNLASRLEEHARVGRILVSETTYQQTRHAVQYGAAAPTGIRGKNERVNAFEVEGLAPGGVSAEDADQFVGRVSEFAQLERLLAQSDRCRSALICGPARAGKSRLVDQLGYAHSDDTEFVFIRCSDFVELGPAAAAQSLVHLLRQKLAARPTLVDTQELPTQPGEVDADEAPPSGALLESLATSLTNLLGDLARDRPVVVGVDRIDLADSATRSLFDGARTLLEDNNILWLATARGLPSDAWPADAQVVEMGALNVDECRQLIDFATGGADIDPPAVERLIALSAALPGVLVELVRVALDTTQLRATDGVLRMPAAFDIRKALAVRTGIQARLDGLTSHERWTLWLSAVVGASVSSALVADALELTREAAGDVLERLAALGLMERVADASTTTDHAYAVREELTRLVIDASLTQLERRRLHERAALALQHTYDPAQPDPPAGPPGTGAHRAALRRCWSALAQRRIFAAVRRPESGERVS